jgi:hypothetical protein
MPYTEKMNPVEAFVSHVQKTRLSDVVVASLSEEVTADPIKEDRRLHQLIFGQKIMFLPSGAVSVIQKAFGQRVKVFRNGTSRVRCVRCFGGDPPPHRLIDACFFFAAFLDGYVASDGPPITVYYCNALGEKILADLSADNINSGVTLFGPSAIQIVIYRKEEATKVLFHELIHAYGIDVDEALDASSAHLRAVMRKFGMRSGTEVRTQETYTELLAAICFTIYKSGRKSKRKLRELFRFFGNQADKLLCVHGTRLSQETHAVEYIIAKAALVENGEKRTSSVIELFDSHAKFATELVQRFESYVDKNHCTLRSLPW